MFATKSDWLLLLEPIERSRPVQYVLADHFPTTDAKTFEFAAKIPNLGIAPTGDFNHEPCYLFADRGTTIESRSISLVDGTIVYAVDQRTNPKSIAIHFGGLFGENFLIGGSVGTISNEPVSLNLFALLKNHITRQFSKIESVYVGEMALKLLNQGFRLTSSRTSPLVYDLKLKKKVM